MTQSSIFGLLRQTKNDWLEEARDLMERELTEGRAYVTSDDVWAVHPLPNYLHKNTMGNVFDGRFKSVGFTASRRPSAHGRTIRQWALSQKG